MNEALDRAGRLGYPHAEIDRLRGFGLVRQSLYAQAEPLLLAAARVKRDPDPRLCEALARTYLQTYRLEAARAVLKRWMREAPGDARPWLWLTEIDGRTETDAETTASHYREALKRDPSLDSARLGLAEVLRAGHRTAEAEAAYREYLARKPDDRAALVGAGINAAEGGDPAAALEYLGRAVAVAPDDPAAYKERGWIRFRRGEGAALEDLDRAAGLDPFDRETRHRRALVLASLGREADARAEQQAAERLRAEEDELNGIRRKLNADPRNVELQLAIARWMFDHGKGEAGVRWAETILAATPDHAATNRLLADHYGRTGQAGLANFYRTRAGTPSP